MKSTTAFCYIMIATVLIIATPIAIGIYYHKLDQRSEVAVLAANPNIVISMNTVGKYRYHLTDDAKLLKQPRHQAQTQEMRGLYAQPAKDRLIAFQSTAEQLELDTSRHIRISRKGIEQDEKLIRWRKVAQLIKGGYIDLPPRGQYLIKTANADMRILFNLND